MSSSSWAKVTFSLLDRVEIDWYWFFVTFQGSLWNILFAVSGQYERFLQKWFVVVVKVMKAKHRNQLQRRKGTQGNFKIMTIAFLRKKLNPTIVH